MANIPKTINCTEHESNLLINVHIEGQDGMEGLISRLTTEINLREEPPFFTDFLDSEDEELSLTLAALIDSRNILLCAKRKLKSIYYKCVPYIKNRFIMQTMPLLGNEVKVSSKLMHKAGNLSLAATIIHEATHKCGTSDGAYFYQDKKKPANLWFAGWSYIASTYDYWFMKGFCIPGEDC